MPDALVQNYFSGELGDVELHSLLSPFDEDVLLSHRRGEGRGGISRLGRGLSEVSGERAWGGATQQISDILQNTALIQSAASAVVGGVHLAAGIDVQPGSFVRSGMQAGIALGANLFDRRYGSKGVLPDEITDIDALASDLGDLDVPDHAGFYLKKVFEKSGAGTARWGQGSLSQTLSGYSASDLEGMFGESGSTLLLAQAEQARRFGQRSHQTQRDVSETVLGLFSGDFARSRRHVYDPESGDVSQEVSKRVSLNRILDWAAPKSDAVSAWQSRRGELRQDPKDGVLDKVFGPLQPEDAQPHVAYMGLPAARGIGRFFGRFHAEPPESRQWIKNWSLEDIVRGASRSETGLLGRWASDIGERKAFRAERSEMLAERRGTGSLYEWQDPEHFHSRIAERMGISSGEDVGFGTERLGDPNSRFGRYFSRLPEKAKYPLTGLAGAAGAKIGYHYLFDSDDEEPLRLEDPAGYSLSPRYPLLGLAQRSLGFRRMRARGEQALDDMFGEDSFHGEMLKSIVLGKKGNLPKDVKERFVESGQIHALVQSGMHVSIFTGLLRQFPALMIPAGVSALKDAVMPPEEEVVAASQPWYSKYQLKDDPWLPRWNPAWAGKKWHDDYDPDFEPPAWAWWDTNASRSRFDDWKPQPPSRGLETGETGVQDVLPWTVYSMFGVLPESVGSFLEQGKIRTEAEVGEARKSEVMQQHLSEYQDRSDSDAALRVNINVADVSELDRLPGIGKRTAERILEYRERDDGFQTIEELLEVRGIGEKTLESIKPFVGLGEDTEQTGYRIDGFEFDVQESPFKGFNPWLDPVPEGSVESEAAAWQSLYAAPVSEYHTSPLFERADELDVEGLPENYLDSVVRISASGLSSGTGFFVDDDVIATNYHVIEKMRGLDEGEEGFWTNFSGVFVGAGEDRREVPIRSVLGVDVANDIALLQVDSVEGVTPLNVVGGMPEVDASNPFPPPLIRSLGYPKGQGEAPQFDLAFYSPYSATDEDTPTFERKVDFEFDVTRVYKGESGSPLFDAEDNVFGILWGRYQHSELEESGGAGYIGLGTSGQDILRLMEAVETSGRRDFEEDEFSSDRDVVSFRESAIEDASVSGLSIQLSTDSVESKEEWNSRMDREWGTERFHEEVDEQADEDVVGEGVSRTPILDEVPDKKSLGWQAPGAAGTNWMNVSELFPYAKVLGVEKLPESFLDSVVQVQGMGIGTGFFVDEDVVATNYHVIEGLKGTREGEEGFHTDLAGVFVGEGEERRRIPVRSILGVDASNDIALLQVDPVENVTPLNVVSERPDQWEVIRSLGYPMAGGTQPQFDIGYYDHRSFIDRFRESKVDFEIESTVAHGGESGSPFFDADNNVFGILWGGRKKRASGLGSDTAVGTSGKDLLRLIDAVDVSGRRDFEEDDFSAVSDVVSLNRGWLFGDRSGVSDDVFQAMVSDDKANVEPSVNFFEKIVGKFRGDGASADSESRPEPETDIDAILQGLRAVREDPNLKEEAWEGDLALDTGYLYKLTNLETGDPYIGLSKNHPLQTGGRIRQHLSGRGSKEIAKVLPEYDASDFSAEVWEIGDLGYRELGYLEQVMIARTGSLEGGYNKTIGGEINEFVDFDKDFARSPDAVPDIDYDRFESAEIALALPPEMFEEEDYFTEDEESQLRRFLAARFAEQPESTRRQTMVRRDAPDIEYTPVVPIEDRIDIQDASELLLQEVPGFHKGLAERSVGFQDAFGAFQTLEGLGEMRGMSRKRLAKASQYLKPIVSTGGASVFPGVDPIERDARPPELLDVETATASEFAALPGIGKVVGERIVSDREARGAFMTPQGIGRVRGVSDNLLEKVSPYLKGFEVARHSSVGFEGLLPNVTPEYMGDPDVQRILGPEGTDRLYDYNLANRPGFARSERVRGLGEVMMPGSLESYHDRPGSADPYLDVDTATWEEFEDLPGVGESLARRIVSYREAEGDFGDYRGLSEVPGVSTGLIGSWEQYFEPFSSVSGLRPSSFQELPLSDTVLDFQVGSETPWDIDINQATLDDWTAVPGVSRRRAHDIFMHRGARGDFRDVDDLQERVGLSRSVYEMLLPRQDIDLNRASAMQLSFLPGIGQERAERIVGDRERFGDFESFADLGRVEGIGESLLDRLSGYRPQPVSRGFGGFEREFTPYPTDMRDHIPMYDEGDERDPAAPLFGSTNIEEVPLESGFQYSLGKFREREGIGDFPSDKARERERRYGRRRTISEIPVSEVFSYFAEDELSQVPSDLFSGFVRGGEINAEVERRLAKLELNQVELEREIQQDRTLTVSQRTEALGQLEDRFAPQRERLEGYEVSTSDVLADVAERAGASILDRTLSFAGDKLLEKAGASSLGTGIKAFGSKALSGLSPLTPALAPIALVAATVAIGESSLNAGYEEVIESQKEREQAFYEQVVGERQERPKIELPEGFKIEDFLTDRVLTLISRKLRLTDSRGITRR